MTNRHSFVAALAFAFFGAIAFAQQDPVDPPVPTEQPLTIPGRVHLRLDPSIWVTNFALDPKGNGIERLSPKSQLASVLRSMKGVRLWRTYGQVEVRVGKNRVNVVAYETWERKWDAKRERRPNERPYEPLSLPGAPSLFELDAGTEVTDAMLDVLRKIEGVVAAERVTRPATQFTPNDPGWLPSTDPGYDAALAVGRWGFHNTGAALAPDYLDDFDIDAPEAWDLERGDPALVVAVLDSGFDVAHPDLYLNIFINAGEVPAAILTAHRAASGDDGLPDALTYYDLNVPAVVAALAEAGLTDTNGNGYVDPEDAIAWWSDGVDDDGNGYADDISGWDFVVDANLPVGYDRSHGTSTAGLIAATADNGRNIAGVAHRVRILPVAVPFSYFSALTYTVSVPEVRLINSSTSSFHFGPTLRELDVFFRSLNARGITYVGSLGNVDGLYYGAEPAQRENVIAVTNFDATGRRDAPRGSGAGPKTDVAAPGDDVVSTLPGGAHSPFGGTSAASPMTAGVAALVMSRRPEISPEQVRQFLRMTASDPVPVTGDRGENTPGWDFYSGWGLVNARRALDAAAGGIEFAEANITSRVKNFRDEFFDQSIGIGPVDIRAMIGLPFSPSTGVRWTLRRSRNPDMSGAVLVAEGVAGYAADLRLTTIDTDALDGPVFLELEVRTPAGAVSRDRAVIDLPRAFLVRSLEGTAVIASLTVHGLAYGPGFTGYRFQVAPGWSPSDAEFRDVAGATFTTPEAPFIPPVPGEVTIPLTLGTVDLRAPPIVVPPSGEVTLRLVTRGSRTWHADAKIIVEETHPPLRSGFPVPLGSSFAPGSPTAADLDRDGRKELIVPAFDLVVKRTDGTDQLGFPAFAVSEGRYRHPVAVGDLDGDGVPELVARTTDFPGGMEWLRVLRAEDGMPAAGWAVPIPVPTPRSTSFWEESPAVLADIDRDGRLDILISVHRTGTMTGPVIRAYRHDGSLIREFATTGGTIIGPLAVGDLDADGSPEVVAAVGLFESHLLYAWRADGSVAWTSPAGGPVGATVRPALIDVDDDGRLEVAVSAAGTNVAVFDAAGVRIAFSFDGGKTLAVSHLHPAVSSNPSVILAERSFGLGPTTTTVHVLDAATLTPRPGWAGGVVFSAGIPEAQPIIADLRGDDRMEIATVNHPFMPEDVHLAVAEMDGTLVADAHWPIRIPGVGIWGTPVVTDLDADGRLDLAVASAEELFVFELPTTAHAGAVGWGEYAHDPKHTSNYHGDLRILEPSTVYPAAVGAFHDTALQRGLIARIHFSRGRPAHDTDTARWRVTVGSVAAPVLSVRRVRDEHWVEVAPVAQPGPGPRTLRVEFNDGGIRTWDAYRDAVAYDVRPQVTLLFDTSGSMRERFDGTSTSDPAEQKIALARAAAIPFLELLSDFGSVATDFGIAAFPLPPTGCESYVVSPMRLVDDASIATATTVTIPGIRASGPTPLLLGIERARTMMAPGAPSAIVLLSDGYQNCPTPAGATHPDTLALIGRLQAQGARVFAIGFGMPADIDHPLLEALASGTTPPGFAGTQFYDVTTPSFDPAAWDPATALQTTYKSVFIDALGLDAIVDPLETIAGGSKKVVDVPVTEHDRIVSFYLSWKTHQPGRLQMTIRASDGAVVPPTAIGVRVHAGPTHAILTVGPQFLKQPGKVGRRPWTFEIRSASPGPNAIEPFQYSVIVDSELRMRGRVSPRMPKLDEPLRLELDLRELGKPVGAAKAFVTINAPSAKKRATVALVDDGSHGDELAGDGIHTGFFRAEAPGVYTFLFHAEGTSANGLSFTRERVVQSFIGSPKGDPPAN